MSEVVYRGTLTKEKLKELATTHGITSLTTDENTIIIQRQPDGNWKGFAKKFNKHIEVREINPETCLQMILTHP